MRMGLLDFFFITEVSEAAGSAASTSAGLDLGGPVELLRERWLSLVTYSPRIAIALVIFLIAWWISRLVGRWQRPYRALKLNPFAVSLLQQTVRIGVILAGLFVALDVLQATALAGAVLGTAGVAGLALGFAFKDIVENYIAGILLSLRQPFSPKDFVDVGGHQGMVMRLTSRATLLMTLDGNHLRLPNAMVFKAVITNYSRAPKRRFDFAVGVGVNEDLIAAQELGLSILGKMAGVLADPEPSAEIVELGDSNVSIRFYAWVDQREVSFTKARSEAVRLVKTAFDDAEIEMPEPIYRVLITERNQEGPRVTRRSPPAEGAVARDLSADDTIERQIADEQAESPQNDLLDQAAPLE